MLIFVMLLLGAQAAMAAPFHPQRGDRDAMRAGQKGMLEQRHGPRVGNQQAAAQVKRAFSNYKILSMQLMKSASAPPVYRVKALTPEGVVKYVYVDAMSGDVFE